MTTYVAVSAVRIQSWLVRTPQLLLMRGASAALSTLTSTPAITAALRSWGWEHDVAVVEAAGEVDGVVVVSVSGQHRPGVVAHRLMRHLGTQLPGVDWEAWWADSDSYAAAYGTFHGGAASRAERFAPLLEATLARTCPECRAEPARPGGAPGADCRAREEAARSTKSNATADCPLPGRPPRDFDELARVGGLPAASRAVGRGLSSNHLATVVADGNRVGNTFTELRALNNDALNEGAVRALNRATRAALYRVLMLVAPSPEVQAGIVHFVGGDDVFVSVPAREAWRFAAWLAREFDHEMRDALQQLGADTHLDLSSVDVPSLGIGMVFADSRHPIAETHGLATAALRQAKRATHGLSSAVVWADLTAESHPPADRWVPISDLFEDLELEPAKRTSAADARRAVMHLPPSARASLASLFAGSRGSGDVDGAEIAAIAAQWARRTGRELLPGLDSDRPADARNAAIQTRDLLSRARWWPDNRTGDPQR